MRKLLLLPLLYALFVAGSCESEPLDPISTMEDQTFFPLTLNQPLFYGLDSIVVFNTTGGIVYDTTHAEVRETLVEMFVETDGTETYRGERWQRADESSPWQFIQTYTVSRTGSAAFREEDNLRFTKLIFPIAENLAWDGNAAFDARRQLVIGGEFLDVFNGWGYRYDTVGVALTLPTGRSFDRVIRVEQADVDNLIDFREAYEIYAPGVGLVERFIDARATQCRVCCGGNNPDTALCSDLPWDEKAEKGFIIRQVLR
ncbi:MAG: hypothetical protein AAF597_16345 [Bacteroidota bacterium]